jgi:uncharacterized membrane protein YphA (DoxX/SURF4 family)
MGARTDRRTDPTMATHDASAAPASGPPVRQPAPALRAPRPLKLRPLGSPSYPSPSRFWRAAGTFGGCLLGGILLVAVWGKALDPAAFAQQIHTDGLDRLLPAGPLALFALALEGGLGLALLLGVRRLWVLVPASLLVAFFLLLNGRAYWLAAHGQAGAAASCGCFGNLVQRTPAQAFWQDLALLGLPLALAFAGRDRNLQRLPPVRTALVVVFAIAVPAFAWRAPELPLDDLATRLAPGATMSKLCVGGGGGGIGSGGGAGGGDRGGAVCLDTVAPELDRGNHLVLLDDVDDPALARAVAGLNAYADTPGAAAVWVLTASDEKRRRLFFWRWGPAFKVVEAPAELLRPLYRRLPRSFAVQDGRVTATFSGLPLLPSLTPTAPSGGNPHPSARPNR